jgi:RNA polymerase sigma factor for flagellar operon FliA
MKTAAATEASAALLWPRKAKGDQHARVQLIELYFFLVGNTVRRAVPAPPAKVEMDDLYSEAHIALVKAVDEFDPGRGTKFTTYAITLIRVACREWLRQEDWVTRTYRDLARDIERAEMSAQAQHPDHPITEAEVAAELGWSEEWLGRRRLAARPITVTSLAAALPERAPEHGQPPLLVAETICDPAPPVLDQACARIARKTVLAALSYLPAADREVLISRYYRQQTGAAHGEGIGRSQSAVQQRHDKALRRLRYLLRDSSWLADGA